MKVSFHFKIFIFLRVFVVSVILMQVCLFLRISDDGNLNLQSIGHIRARVISKCGASWQCMRGLASSLTDRNTTFPLISWLKYQEVEDVKACLHSEPGGAATSTGCLELRERFLFVTKDWIGVPPAMEWAKDTSVLQLQKNLPIVMTSSAQNINTSAGNHWIVINIKNENIGKTDSPHGISTLTSFFKELFLLFSSIYLIAI